MASTKTPSSPGREIRQQRGRKTYDALVATGFRLLETNEFDSITIAELAREAGYSVGAFYARFHSKDEFLDALIAQHLDYRVRARARVVARSTEKTLIENLIKELVTYYWRRRRFWRAALLRSMRDPTFGKPLRDHAKRSADVLIKKFSEVAGRELTENEKMNTRFALHVVLGSINNSIVNHPGPVLFLGREQFIKNLTRTFRLVSDYDSLKT